MFSIYISYSLSLSLSPSHNIPNAHIHLSYLQYELSQMPLPSEVASTLESVNNNIQSLTDVLDDHQLYIEILAKQLATLKGKE